ncbi:cutinase family protein [Gordonia jinghuaiqii]|uniref:Cutinase n=1 Tax=Gordonia jinghuaiqii TaxID=2758710 RepID=A0A7D7QWN3_9ACTN|nr:cutinase family protein [Gordonia jinghuaiqii]MCR5978358.1 cutinase family protein [Gordonia jinghuaiqii]QMT01209.1 cutinase family protein [Gordonia jinghuaiqii]
MGQMIKRLSVSVLCLIAAATGAVVTGTPAAQAAPCSDVEVVFARGTVETAPPLGLTGLSFVEAVRSQLPGRSVAAYGVPYPASDQFNNRLKFAQTVADGVRATQNRVKYLAATCPGTKVVLGGYSQGAVVAGYSVHSGLDLPARYAAYDRYVPPPLPAALSRNVAAIVLFGTPSDRFITDIGAPPVKVAAPYRGKTVRYCVAGDTICDGSPVGGPNALHVLYSVNGMTLDGARYVARHV